MSSRELVESTPAASAPTSSSGANVAAAATLPALSVAVSSTQFSDSDVQQILSPTSASESALTSATSDKVPSIPSAPIDAEQPRRTPPAEPHQLDTLLRTHIANRGVARAHTIGVPTAQNTAAIDGGFDGENAGSSEKNAFRAHDDLEVMRRNMELAELLGTPDCFLPTYYHAINGEDGGLIERGPLRGRAAIEARRRELREQREAEARVNGIKPVAEFHFEPNLAGRYRPPPVLRYTPFSEEGSGYLTSDGEHSSWTIMMRQTDERVVGTDGSVEQHIAYDLFDEDEQLAYTVWRVNELKSSAVAASTAAANTATNTVSSATSSVNSWLSAAMRRGKAATAASATASATQSSTTLDGYVQHIMQRADHGCPSLDPFHGASPLWQAVLDLADLETAVRNMYDTAAISTALSTESRRAFGSSLKCGFRTAVLSDAGESEARLARAALRKDMDIKWGTAGAMHEARGLFNAHLYAKDKRVSDYLALVALPTAEQRKKHIAGTLTVRFPYSLDTEFTEFMLFTTMLFFLRAHGGEKP